jgi:coproporphyrinogen III oxidase-like Fe-S oxidoreductase
LDHIGIGAGAVGWRDGTRRKNLSHPEQWADAVLRGDAAAQVEDLERPDPHTRLFDHLMMGLRLSEEGVLLSRVHGQTGLDPLEVYGPRLNKSLDDGWLERIDFGDGPRLRTTARGMELLDELLRDLAPITEV